MRTVPFFSLLITGLLLTSSLWAFHPIRFNPLDRYVLAPQPGGPQKMQIFNADGKAGKSAQLVYNAKGQLTKEVYYDQSGTKEGESRLTYLDDRLVKEELFGKKEELLNRRTFEYTGKDLVKMRVYDAKGDSQLEQIYQYQRDYLTGGQENNGTGFLSFKISYSDGLASTIRIHNDEHNLVSMIYLKYNPDGQVIERVRSQGDDKHKFIYSYNDKKIKSYQLQRQVKGKWVTIRKIEFTY